MEGAEFVTVYRYVDWILTTPLMLIKFPLILGLGPRGRMFMVRLILLDLIMITFGFFGELNADNAALRYGFFAVGGFAWLIILGLLFKAMNNLPASTPDSVISGARIMFFLHPHRLVHLPHRVCATDIRHESRTEESGLQHRRFGEQGGPGPRRLCGGGGRAR